MELTMPGQLPTITAKQAMAACARFMNQWGPDDDEDDYPFEDLPDPLIGDINPDLGI